MILRSVYVLVFFCFLFGRLGAAETLWIQATVTQVKDGDSILVKTEAKQAKVIHLLAAVAPGRSRGSAMWEASQQTLEQMIGNRAIRFRKHTANLNEFAIVELDGESINLKMIESGHAWFQPTHLVGGRFEKARKILAAAQQRAEQNGRGLWANEEPLLRVAPWELANEIRKRIAARGDGGEVPWGMAPPTMGGLAVVNNMERFSDKLDVVAESIDQLPPHVLDYAIRKSRFEFGLFREGTLMWWFEPDTNSESYLIPAIDGETLIRSRLGHYEHYMSGVIEGKSYQAVAIDHYGIFSQNEPWLKQCADSEGGFDKQIPELNQFLNRQDIGLAVRDSVADLPLDRLPFSKGNYVIGDALPMTAATIARSLRGVSFATGTELLPPDGVRVSVAAAVPEESEAAEWPATMTVGRDRLLANLPDLAPALVVAFSSCDSWNEQLAATWDNEIGSPIDFEKFRGLTLVVYPLLDSKADDPLAWFRIDVHVDQADASLKQLQQFLEAQLAARGDGTFELATSDLDGRVVLELSFEPMLNTIAKDRVNVCITALDNERLLVQGGGMTHLRAAITNPDNLPPLIKSDRIQRTLDLTFDDSQQLVMLDLPGVLRLASQLSALQNPKGGNFLGALLPAVDPDLKLAPYAVSGRFTSSLIELNVVAPTDQLKYVVSSDHPLLTWLRQLAAASQPF